jgi:predicted GIY-YIG superfamily endonuclease
MKKSQKVKSKEGYLYIISNPAYPGFYKIGVTEDIKSRLHVYQTSDPKRKFKVEFHIFHPDCYQAEKNIKEMMNYFALSQRNEWFECDLQTAIVRLQEQVECLDE